MTRIRTILVAIVVVVSVVGVTPPMAAATGDQVNESDGEVVLTPGEQLSVVIGVQDAAVRGEIDERAVGISMARAATDETRAEKLVERLDELETRVEELEERREALQERRETGEISEGRYNAEITRLSAEVERTERLLTVLQARAERISEERFAERSVDRDRFETLEDRLDALVGSDERERTRAVAGISVGPPDRLSGDERTDGVVERIERADAILDRTEQRIVSAERTVGDDEAGMALVDRAWDEFADGQDALENAREALDNGDHRVAVRYVTVAVNHARTADALATRAIAVADVDDGDAADESAAEAQRYIDRASEAHADASAVVDRANERVGDDPTANAYLDRAENSLDKSASALEDARSANERGEYRIAIRHASVAAFHATNAERYAERAMDLLDWDDGDRAEAAVEHAASTVDRAEAYIERAKAVAGDDEAARAYLVRADSEFDSAQSALRDARAALDRGEPVRAIEHARQSIADAQQAIEYARAAIDVGAVGDVPVDDTFGDAIIDDPELAIQRASHATEAASESVERAGSVVDDDEEALRYLRNAREELHDARSTLADARHAYVRNDRDRALDLAIEAYDHATQAIGYAERAMETDDDQSHRG